MALAEHDYCAMMQLLTRKPMDDEEILQLVADGELDSSEIDDFKELGSELQEMVVSGELSLDEAMDFN